MRQSPQSPNCSVRQMAAVPNGKLPLSTCRLHWKIPRECGANPTATFVLPIITSAMIPSGHPRPRWTCVGFGRGSG
jgi:hypothetical protein